MKTRQPDLHFAAALLGARGGKERAKNMTAAERSAEAQRIASLPRKPDADRCPCGAMTAKRAAARAHKCQR